MAHFLGWQDGGSAALTRCGFPGVDLKKHEIILTAPEFNMGRTPTVVCPNCHKKLRLVWDVRIEEVSE